jgi:hypothetical protein
MTDADNDDVQFVGQTSAADSKHILTEFLQNVVAVHGGAHLRHGTASSNIQAHCAAPIRTEISQEDILTVQSTFQRCSEYGNQYVVHHGNASVDGAAFLTLQEDTWVQVPTLLPPARSYLVPPW